MTKELLQNEDLSNKLLTKWFRIYFFIILTAPIWYILRIILSNTITVEELGLFYGALGLITLLATYNDLWLTESLQYFIPQYWIKGEKSKIKLNVIASFLMQMFTGIVIFCGLYFWAEYLAEFWFHNGEAEYVLKTMAFYFLWYNIIQLCSTIFTSFQDTCAQGATDFTRQLGILIFTLVYWTHESLTLETYSQSRIWGVLIGVILGLILFCVKYLPVFKHIKLWTDKQENKATLKKHFSYALLVFLTTNITTILGQIDLQIVTHFIGNEDAGYFTNFQSLLGIFNLVANSVITLFIFPLISELHSKKEEQKFRSLKTILYSYFWVFSLFCSGLFFLFWKEFAILLFSESYEMSGTLMQIVAPFLIFNSRFTISFSILAGLGLIKKRFSIIVFSLLVNLLLNGIFIFYLEYGIQFSALIMAITWLVMALLWLYQVKKQGDFPIKWKFLLKNICLITVLTLVFFNLKKVLPFGENTLKNRTIIFWIILFYTVVLLIVNYKETKDIRNRIKRLRHQ